jgi:glycosyltransferase involved in cell wall biosynthesis
MTYPRRKPLRGLRWRLRAMRRLWSPEATVDMRFLPPPGPTEQGPAGWIDHPRPGTLLDQELVSVFGWVAFPAEATARVEVWFGEHSLGRARVGLLRVDVRESTDFPYGTVAGFEFGADFDSLPASIREGKTMMRVVATGAKGETYEFEPVPIRISPPRQKSKPERLPARIPGAAERPGLRTAVFTHQLTLGGAQLYLLDLLRGLVEREAVAPTVVCAIDGPVREELEELGIPVHITNLFPTGSLASHLGRVEELTAWADPQGFERVLINTATSQAFSGAEVAMRLGIPAIWAIHESFPPAMLWGDLHPSVRARAEAALEQAAFAVFEADATRHIFEPFLDSERCLTLPYGVDFGAFDRTNSNSAVARRKARIPRGADVLLCVGTVEPRKAQIALAQAFDLIADDHPDAMLVFVGGRENDPHSTALQEFIEFATSGERIRLIPITPNVEPWYGLANVLVCASDVESLPRTVLEAMGWETPVLATSVFGLPDLIDDGETGWLCEPRDISALAEGLDRALSATPETRREIGRRARALVEDRHSLPRYAEEISKLLDRADLGTVNGAQRRITSE